MNNIFKTTKEDKACAVANKVYKKLNKLEHVQQHEIADLVREETLKAMEWREKELVKWLKKNAALYHRIAQDEIMYYAYEQMVRDFEQYTKGE